MGWFKGPVVSPGKGLLIFQLKSQLMKPLPSMLLKATLLMGWNTVGIGRSYFASYWQSQDCDGPPHSLNSQRWENSKEKCDKLKSRTASLR